MDPATLAIVSSAVAAVGTGVSAYGQSTAMKNQAKSDQQRAAIEGQWAERRALEERVAGQRAAAEEMRKADLAQSRLMALAGASGGRTDDKTVMDLWKGIEGEGIINAGNAAAAGNQRAAGLSYQDALGRWTADSNARIKNASAQSTLIGGMLSAAGQMGDGYYRSRMAARYGAGDLGTNGGRTGYS